MTAKIRAYQASDLDELLNVWQRSSRLAHPFMPESFFQQELENIPNIYIPNTDTWVFTDDEKLVGFIAIIPSETLVEIGGLFVCPEHHGKKIGKRLTEFANENYGALKVQVFKDNPIGRKFYHRFGFELVKENIWPATGDILLEMVYRG